MTARSRRDVADNILVTLIAFLCLVMAFLCTYPFWFILINSLSEQSEIAKGVFFIPRKLTFQNYQKIFQYPDLYHAAFISAARAVVGTAITVVCSSFLAYMVTRKELIFRKTIYRIIVLTLYFNAGLIPWYILMKNLQLKNSFLLYVIPSAVNAFFLILVKTYIESIPSAFSEAAEVDGAGHFTVFFRVLFPISLPIIATISVFSAVGQWNSWADNFFLVSARNLKTLQLILRENLLQLSIVVSPGSTPTANLKDSAKISPMSIRMTMTMVTVFPIMLVYPSLQRYFVKGIMLGAIKG